MHDERMNRTNGQWRSPNAFWLRIAATIQVYELGVAEADENSRLFSDLVELAKQLLRRRISQHLWMTG